MKDTLIISPTFNEVDNIQKFIDSVLDDKTSPISKKSIFDLMTACFYADLSQKKGKELKINYLK